MDVNIIIDALAKAKSSLLTEIANIDEEYRKKLEEAKKALNEQLEEVSNQYGYWLAIRGDVPMPEKKTRKKREKKEEVPAPPKDATEVVDTIYPENNEPEETQEEPLPEMLQNNLPDVIEEEAPATSGSLFDFPEDPSTVPAEEPVESTETVEDFPEDDWGEPKDTVVEKEPMNLDDFEIPEEWK